MCYNMEKYTEKKQRNQVFQKFIKRHIGENQMDLVQDCNTFLIYCIIKDKPNASFLAFLQAQTGQNRFLQELALYNFCFSKVLSATKDRTLKALVYMA